MIRISTAPGEDISLHVKSSCTHSRLVDDVLNKKGNKTGQLVCLECKATFPDPEFQKPVH